MTQSDVSRGTPTPMQQVEEQVSHLWWVPLVVGLVSAGIGLGILAGDWDLTGLVVVTGLLLVIRGVAVMLSPHFAGASRYEHVFAGLLGVVTGVVLLAWPDATLLVLAFFVGAWLAVSGGFHIVLSYARRQALPHWGLSLVIGVVELLLGVWAMRRPEVTLDLIITIIGLWAVITGVVYCLLAFELRRGLRSFLEPVTGSPSRDEAPTAYLR
jgi:uncharacterized membrane protein HdeD (DUF308 family)